MAIKTKPPSGMRDFLPEELVKRNFVADRIKTVYEKYGFVPVETPSIENLTTLLGKYGDEGDQLLFRILHRRDKLFRALDKDETAEKDLADMGLRYDLTVPLARLIANSKNLPKFFKRYQIQPVWRADRPGKGRYREFLQCDVDITGTKSLIAEAEVCSAVAEVLLSLGFDDFTVNINHRQLLKSLIQAANIDLKDETTTLVAVDKMDKIGEEGVLKELKERGILEENANKLLQLIKRPENNSEEDELNRLKKELSGIEGAEQAFADIDQLFALLQTNTAKKHFKIDATLARGLGYYTGPIFEIRSSAFNGSLGGGGRYDGLIGMFRGQEIPAVGFSIGFERLVLVMEERGLFNDLKIGPDVMICHFKDVADTSVMELANTLRASGVKVEVYPETPKLGKQISYAESVGAHCVAILGAKEAEEKVISLKNLATGDQVSVPYTEAGAKILSWK
jgi:histidyl-tRNA synthetase